MTVDFTDLLKVMEGFTEPFPGVKNPGTLTEEELIRALRLDIAAEEDAISLYMAHVDATDDDAVKKVLISIADEERVHVGELQKLLMVLTGNEEADLQNKGAEEVDSELRGE